MSGEIFVKCIVNNNYDVSNLGRVVNNRTGLFLNGHINHKGYRRIQFHKKTYFLGRVIYQSFNLNENLDGLEIDYINKNKLDNHLINLRMCTPQENKGNQSRRSNNKLGEKNISYHQNGYLVVIVKNPLRISKWFKTIDEAIIFRNAKIIEIYGEYASI
jgi:hypothetical protein